MKGIQVSHFIEPSLSVVKVSAEVGVDAIELHTGRYCLATQGLITDRSKKRADSELERIKKAAILARQLGIGAHAGHGFDLQNVRRVAALENENHEPLIEEYNIGHSIICRAVEVGLEKSVREMLSAILAP